MALRRQLILVMAAAVLLPLAALLLAVRYQARDQLTREHRGRVEALIAATSRNLEAEAGRLDQDVASAASTLSAVPALARFLQGDSAWAAPIPGLVERAGTLAGLDALQLQDSTGTVLAGRPSRPLPPDHATLPVFIQLDTTAALLRSHQLRIAGQVLHLRAARDASSLLTPPDSALAIGLVAGGRLVAGTSVSGLSRDIAVLYSGDAESPPTPAALRVAHDLTHLNTVLASLERWLIAAFALVALIGLTGAWWAAGRFTRPIRDLADTFGGLSLESPGMAPRFLAHRHDEIGRLSRTLNAMLSRLRAAASQLQAAERKAALGDFARQANHDIKNAATPLRNVFAHLEEVADDPDELARVFRERRGTLSSGIGYLQTLAGSYGRLSSRPQIRRIDACEEVRTAVAARAASNPRIKLSCKPGCETLADPLALRRLVDNLVTNALEASEDAPVHITVRTTDSWVEVEVADQGPGIPEEDQARVFDDFYSTRESGGGLGLSIVRRLVLDMNGSIDLSSRTGEGTTFTVRLPPVQE